MLLGRAHAMLGQGAAAMRHANGPAGPRRSAGVRRVSFDNYIAGGGRPSVWRRARTWPACCIAAYLGPGESGVLVVNFFATWSSPVHNLGAFRLVGFLFSF